METSAKTGEGINEIFDAVARALPHTVREPQNVFTEDFNQAPNKPKKCC